MRKFHEALPEAAAFIVDLFKSKDSLTPEQYKLTVMRKEAAESVLAYGMGRPGMQQLPKPEKAGAAPLIEFDLGNMEQMKKDGAEDTTIPG